MNLKILVEFWVFTAVVMKSIIFWDMTPCSPLSVNRRFGGTYRLRLQGRRNMFSKKPASKLATCFLAELTSSTMKMDAICSSETSVDTQRTTRSHIPENDAPLRDPCLSHLMFYTSGYFQHFILKHRQSLYFFGMRFSLPLQYYTDLNGINGKSHLRKVLKER
jgi:hypothetical protein